MIYSIEPKAEYNGDPLEKENFSLRYSPRKTRVNQQLPYFRQPFRPDGRRQRRGCTRYLGMERYLVLVGSSLLLLLLWVNLTYSSTILNLYKHKKGLDDPFSTLETSHLGIQQPFQGKPMNGTHGAVAVETQECSDVGTDILKQGGTAVDAAIASSMCIGVMHGFATGIGGGGFMLVRTPNGTYELIDFRERAPQASYSTMFVDDPSLTKYGGLSIGVPGMIRGFELAHKRHGALPWAQLFTPAIKLATDGFRTTQYLYEKLELCETWILKDPGYRKIYAPTGVLAQPGDTLKWPTLAKTLESIAKGGAEAYYTGSIAKSTVRTIKKAGGIITMKDLEDYQPRIRQTIHTYYHGKKITTGSAPTSGPILINMLNILERYNLGHIGRTGLNLHRLVEAMKFGNAFRTELGDPDFNPHLQDRFEEIISKEWASRVRANISDTETHPSDYYQPKYEVVENHGTMHMSIVDKNDGVVSMTTTLNHLFGSTVMDPATGIVFNNNLDDFSIPGVPNFFGYQPSVSNYITPGKRPQSSITPVIVESDGRFFMALGGSGGSHIPTAVASVLTNVLDYNMNLYQAVATHRLHHQLTPNVLNIELGFDVNLGKSLKSRQHEFSYMNRNINFSGVQTVRRLADGTVQAVSEPRKYALASAY